MNTWCIYKALANALIVCRINDHLNVVADALLHGQPNLHVLPTRPERAVAVFCKKLNRGVGVRRQVIWNR